MLDECTRKWMLEDRISEEERDAEAKKMTLAKKLYDRQQRVSTAILEIQEVADHALQVLIEEGVLTLPKGVIL